MRKVLAIGLVSFLLFGCGGPSKVQINSVNPPSALDDADAVRVSVDSGSMRWRDRSWRVVGSQYTPRGRFKLTPVSGAAIGDAVVLAFRELSIDELSTTHPQHVEERRSLLNARQWFVIHRNNLRPGSISAGCLMVSDADLFEMIQLLPGATIIIQ